MCKKNKISNFLLFAVEMTVLSRFWQKNGLGSLGDKLVQNCLKKLILLCLNEV